MKIRPEHLEALKQEQQVRKPSLKESPAFRDILSSELNQAEKTAAPCPDHRRAAVAGLGGLDPLTLASLEVTPTRQKVMEALTSVLSRWDEYSSSLRSPTPDLKQAYLLLETISSDVRAIKESELNRESRQQFDPIINELEILTITERIKFNRGDYV
jgi:hypothetical protein